MSTAAFYESKRAIRCPGWLEFRVELIAFEILFQSVLMHSLWIPLVHRGMFLFRIADRDKIERYKVVRKIEDGSNRSHSLLVRIDRKSVV